MKIGKALIIAGLCLFLTPFIIMPLLMFTNDMALFGYIPCVFGLAFIGFALIFVGAVMGGGTQRWGSGWGGGWGAPGPRPLPYQPYQYSGTPQYQQPMPPPAARRAPTPGQVEEVRPEEGYEPPPAPPAYPSAPQRPAPVSAPPSYSTEDDGDGTAPGDVKQLTMTSLGLQCPQCGGPAKEIGHWGWKRCGQCGFKFK